MSIMCSIEDMVTRRSVTRCVRLLATSLLMVALCGVSAATAASGTQEIPDGSRADWEAIVTAAKKEGKVVVYGVPGVDVEKLFKEHFEFAFPGIKVESVPDRRHGKNCR